MFDFCLDVQRPAFKEVPAKFIKAVASSSPSGTDPSSHLTYCTPSSILSSPLVVKIMICLYFF
mgnify:CR=1 FL=1